MGAVIVGTGTLPLDKLKTYTPPTTEAGKVNEEESGIARYAHGSLYNGGLAKGLGAVNERTD